MGPLLLNTGLEQGGQKTNTTKSSLVYATKKNKHPQVIWEPHRPIEIVERGDALPVVALTSPATPFIVRHAVQRTEGSRLDQHLRKVAVL